MSDSIVISSLRIHKDLATKLNFLAKKEGISKSEIILRALERFLSEIVIEKTRNAEEILKLVELRTGRKPKLIRDPKEIYKEEYRLVGIK